MTKVNQAKLKPNGKYGIVKRLPVLIQAKEILQAVLLNELYLTNAPRKVIEDIAAQYYIGRVQFTKPLFYGRKAKYDEDNFYNQLDQAIAICLRRFPEIPKEEFLDEAIKYRGYTKEIMAAWRERYKAANWRD